MLGKGVGRGRSFRTGDRHRYGGRKKGARVLPRPRLAQKGLRAGRHRSFVDYASVGHDRNRAREVHQRVVEIERITPDAVRADIDLVRADELGFQSGVALGGDGLVVAVSEVFRKLGDAIRRVNPHPVERQERSEEHTSELQSQSNLVCRLLLEKKKKYIDASSERNI